MVANKLVKFVANGFSVPRGPVLRSKQIIVTLATLFKKNVKKR